MNTQCIAVREELYALLKSQEKAEQKKRGRKRIYCSFQQNELKLLQNKAQYVGLKPASYLKAVFFAYQHKDYLLPQKLEAELRRLIQSIHAIGNNLNQIARHANTVKGINDTELKAVFALLFEYKALLERFIKNPERFLRK